MNPSNAVRSLKACGHSSMRGRAEPLRYLEDSVLYICALLRDRPRPIDQFIDYFASPTWEPGSHSDAPYRAKFLHCRGSRPRTGRAAALAKQLRPGAGRLEGERPCYSRDPRPLHPTGQTYCRGSGRAWLERQASQNGGSVSPEKHSPRARVAMPEERSLRSGYLAARLTEKRAAPIDRSARAINQVCRVLTEHASPGPQSLPSAVVHLRCTVGQALNQQALITRSSEERHNR